MLNKNYIKVSSSSITKKNVKDGNIIEERDFATNTFKKYDIPLKYQAMILRNCYTLPFKRSDMYEVTTDKKFTLAEIKISETGEIIMIGGFEVDTDTFINGSFVELTDEETINFFNEIVKAGLAKNYEKAIQDIFAKQFSLFNCLFRKRIRKK